MAADSLLPWENIDTVLVDMDGTLLDLAFDNFFWLDLVPSAYAARHALDETEARRQVLSRYEIARCEIAAGSLAWYSVEHWTQELGLDIRALKSRHKHLINYLPGARRFLAAVRALGKPVFVVTNAHPDTLAIKTAQTQLNLHVDKIFCSHDFAAPKESADFWVRFARAQPFDAERSLLIEDSLAVLGAAERHGLRYTVAIRRPDSRAPERRVESFRAVAGVADLL
ncbi:MAG TPA: HAD family hydrolase [Gammaproteobacteria bacterium]|nr:HAD family hydrolase [Gammaproteobacteria bacterium]